MSASVSPSASMQLPSEHFHAEGEVCPWCEQPIPHEKFAEIRSRIALREQEQFAEHSRKLKDQFSQEKREADTRAKMLLEQAQRDAAITLEKFKADAVAKEAVAVEEARKAALATMQIEIAQSEQAKVLAEKVQATLREQLAKSQKDKSAEIEHIRSEAITAQAKAVEEAKRISEATMQAKLAEADTARKNAEQQTEALKSVQAAALAERLQEQRDALEREKVDAVNAEKKIRFEEALKLSATIQGLQRQVEKKTADELGERPEIDLYDELKSEFSDDLIEHVGKGKAGADIIHTVVYKGKNCGKIIYDSKNRDAWRDSYIAKLAQDQMSEGAEHAVLSTRKFPVGAHQLHVQDGVIIANPARIAALVHVLRKHVIHTHSLRLSNSERSKKTVALYDFVTSEACTQLFERIDVQAEHLLELQVKEKKAHDTTWKRQGELIRSVQKARGDLCAEIDQIIGTAGDSEVSE